MNSFFSAWASAYPSRYRQMLVNDIIPFWMRHALGAEDGALNNCLDDDGRLLSTDRFLWSQGRALWTFSALYRHVEPRKIWRRVSENVFSYLMRHGRDHRGYWMFRLDAQGFVIEADTSIYVDGFVLTGLTEYYLATGDIHAKDLALETVDCIQVRLRTGDYRIAPYSIPPGMKALGIPMIFAKVFHDAGRAFDMVELQKLGYCYAREILTDFYIPDSHAVAEYIALNGYHNEAPEGRVCIPGHVIEAMWFLIRIFEHTGDNVLIDDCCRLILRHLQLGWDDEYGGLRLAVNLDGTNEVAWKQAECKPWWVQAEALVATALALSHDADPVFVDWHQRLYEYALTHYPQPSGEWTQWLDRRGRRTTSAALPVKDPFHLPRALIVLSSMASTAASSDPNQA